MDEQEREDHQPTPARHLTPHLAAPAGETAHDPAHGPDERRYNRDFPWDEFDSESYWALNFKTLRDDDREIIEVIGDFFDAECAGRTGLHGIDVGPGANLYPALAMLPFCEEIRLHEFAASNVRWLRGEVTGFRAEWDPFWAVLAERPSYRAVADPRARLKEVARPYHDSVFELPSPNLPAATWDIGTMFFGAESMTTDLGEFDRALEGFAQALKPGAPYAVAFMMGSQGYWVGEIFYPAVSIYPEDVHRHLGRLSDALSVKVVGEDATLREGYHGMMIATGRTRGG